MHTHAAFVKRLQETGSRWIWTRTEELAFYLEKLMRPPTIGVSLPASFPPLPDSVQTTDLTPDDLINAQVGVTLALFGIAETGTIVIDQSPPQVEPVSLFPPRHVAIVPASRIVNDIATALEALSPKTRPLSLNAVFATGPSATADMGALVQGVHGPDEVVALIVENR